MRITSTRYRFTLSARRWLRSRLYSDVPNESLKPGARPLLGPALSPGNLLVKVFGRLIAVLVASSVPLRAGCGRPDVELLLSKDCSCSALGSFERLCAVERSMSFR